MAEENDMGLASEVVAKDTPVQKSETKKTRAPRRQKSAVAASEMTTSASPAADPATPVRRGPGRKPKAVDAAADTSTKNAVKATRMKRVAKPVAQTAKASVTARDEMNDLVQLEEENKKLRKTLAEKLRTENADLRKRLGLD